MAVQKKRKSRSKRDMRRKQNSKQVAVTALSVDKETGETHRRHHVTDSGFYRGVQRVKSFAAANEEQNEEE